MANLQAVVKELRKQNDTLGTVSDGIKAMLSEDVANRKREERQQLDNEEAKRRTKARVQKDSPTTIGQGVRAGVSEGLGINLLAGMAGGLATMVKGLIPSLGASLTGAAILGGATRLLTKFLLRAGIVTLLANFGEDLFYKLLDTIDPNNVVLSDEAKEAFAGGLNMGSMGLVIGSTLGGIFGMKYALLLGGAGLVGGFLYDFFEKKFKDTKFEKAFEEAFDTEFGSEILAGIGAAVGTALAGVLGIRILGLVRTTLGIGAAAAAVAPKATPPRPTPANIPGPPGSGAQGAAGKPLGKFSMGMGILSGLLRLGLPIYAITALDAQHKQRVDQLIATGMTEMDAMNQARAEFSNRIENAPGIKELSQFAEFQKNLAREYNLPQADLGPHMGATKVFDYLRNLYSQMQTEDNDYFAAYSKMGAQMAAQERARLISESYRNEFEGISPTTKTGYLVGRDLDTDLGIGYDPMRTQTVSMAIASAVQEAIMPIAEAIATSQPKANGGASMTPAPQAYIPQTKRVVTLEKLEDLTSEMVIGY